MIKEIAIVWTIDDVLEQRPELNEQQASDVLKFMKSNHDATIGINWDYIDAVAETLFPA
jgi:hypothetical protein